MKKNTRGSEVTLTVKQIKALCDVIGDDVLESPEELDTEYTIYIDDYGPMVMLTESPENGSDMLDNL